MAGVWLFKEVNPIANSRVMIGCHIAHKCIKEVLEYRRLLEGVPVRGSTAVIRFQ